MCSCGVSSQVVQVLPLVFSYGKFPYDSCGISRLFGHRAVSIEACGAVKTKIQNLLKRRVKHRVLLFSAKKKCSDRRVSPLAVTRTCSVTLSLPSLCAIVSFFFNDTATSEIYTLSLHDALPI